MECRNITEDASLQLQNSGIYLDLMLIIIWMMGALIVLSIPQLWESILRIVISLPIILFFPGYSLVASFFPSNRMIDGLERVAFSFGFSIALVPLMVFGLNYTELGIRFDPIFLSLILLTSLLTVCAYIRRLMIHETERYSVSIPLLSRGIINVIFGDHPSFSRKIVGIFFILSILVVTGTSAMFLTAPERWEPDTEFYVLGSEGIASDYPEMSETRGTQAVTIGIINHEHRSMVYTLEVFLAVAEESSAGNVFDIVRMERVDQQTILMNEDEASEFLYNFTIGSESYNRIIFLLFKGENPADDVWFNERIAVSYRHLFLQVPKYRL